jgi:hypothetical protein
MHLFHFLLLGSMKVQVTLIIEVLMSGLSVLLRNHCFDLDARASAAPPRMS